MRWDQNHIRSLSHLLTLYPLVSYCILSIIISPCHHFCFWKKVNKKGGELWKKESVVANFLSSNHIPPDNVKIKANRCAPLPSFLFLFFFFVCCCCSFLWVFFSSASTRSPRFISNDEDGRKTQHESPSVSFLLLISLLLFSFSFFDSQCSFFLVSFFLFSVLLFFYCSC